MSTNGIPNSARRGRLARKALATLGVALVFCTVPTIAQETVLDRLIQRTRSGESSAATESPQAGAKTPEPTAASEGDPVRGRKLGTTSLESAKPSSQPSLQSPGPSVRTVTSKPKIPLASPKQGDKIKIEPHDELISIVARDAPLSEVLELLAHEKNLNLVTAENIRAVVSVNLKRVRLEDALDTMLSVAGYTWTRDKDIVIVTSLAGVSKLAPHTQGRTIRVFRLDYASARDISAAIAGFLSPAGQSFVTQAALQDNRKTQDVVVVEDIPAAVERVAEYIAQVDVPPRQVLIEARVLQVTLRDNYVNGVNLLFDELSKKGFGEELRIDMQANPLASPAFLFTLSRKDLNVLIELLETTTDAKNLASPKVLVVNGQEAHFQVGQRIGYKQVTTTETSSQESIGFLDVGVQIRARPYISGDNNVLMHVKPEVSSGRINLETGAPDAEIIQVDTDVLLPNGRGMVIGGLIQEEDSNLQSKVPFMGDLWLVGRLFQRRQVNKERKEVIIVLVPSIVPHETIPTPEYEQDVQRSLTPLFHGPLNRVSRPWEPRMPDAVENPVLLQESVPKARLLRLSAPCGRCIEPCGHVGGDFHADAPLRPIPLDLDLTALPSGLESDEVVELVDPTESTGDPEARIEQ